MIFSICPHSALGHSLPTDTRASSLQDRTRVQLLERCLPSCDHIHKMPDEPGHEDGLAPKFMQIIVQALEVDVKSDDRIVSASRARAQSPN